MADDRQDADDRWPEVLVLLLGIATLMAFMFVAACAESAQVVHP